jgi:cobalt-zinc-cadmium efflux system membrane fusion protein
MNGLRVASMAAAGLILSSGCGRDNDRRSVPVTPSGIAILTDAQVRSAQLAVEPVVERSFDERVSTSGKLTFYDLRVTHVVSPVTGRVIRIEVQPGQRVEAGDVLARLDSPDLGNARSDLLKAEAEAAAAERDLARQQELIAIGASSQKDLEAARADAQKASAELDRARRKARLLGAGASRGARRGETFALRAPIAGEIVRRNVNPGTEVQGEYSGGPPAALFTVGALDPIVVLADVFEIDLARVKVGAELSLTVPTYPGRVFRGTIDWVSDQLDPTTRAAQVRCLIPNPDRALKPEMYAAVSIRVPGRPALAVPRTAVLRLGTQEVAFVEDHLAPDGRRVFERRPIEVDDERGGEFLRVLRGLHAGDRVVSRGAILLSGMAP